MEENNKKKNNMKKNNQKKWNIAINFPVWIEENH